MPSVEPVSTMHHEVISGRTESMQRVMTCASFFTIIVRQNVCFPEDMASDCRLGGAGNPFDTRRRTSKESAASAVMRGLDDFAESVLFLASNPLHA
ncbi:hypothetical protein GCM10029978_032400 [Actinoallomurus acanthiterrae]